MNNLSFIRSSDFSQQFIHFTKNATFKVIFPLTEKHGVKYISISYTKWISNLEIDVDVMCVIQKEKELQHFSTPPEAGVFYTERNKRQQKS